ncbi:YbbR-like domain-containing protein [Cohnella yongneupensis]|uniref:YbbR-like domain-containing protein n=1 Tax=Cohnella yongneupensis TaxID=425006 RepID=A0ABW0R1K6_9BACL
MDKWLNHPTAAKLLALGIAILMWAVVHYNQEAPPNTVATTTKTKTLTLNVQPYGLDESNFVLTEFNPGSVTIKVSGSSAALLAKTENYKLQVDLRPLGEGTHKVEIDANLPRGLDLVDIEPSTVQVTLVALQTKEFEVEVVTEGSPAKGYKAGTPIVKPSNKVHVTLPDNVMERVASVRANISIDGEQETIKNKGVKLAAYDEKGKVIENAKLEPAVVEVEVPITNPFKTIPLQFKLSGHMPTGLSIASFKPDAEQVTVYGPQDALDKLEFLEVNVPLDDLKNSGKVTIPLTIGAPIIEVSPAQIEISVEVVLSETRTLEGLPITWKGLNDGLSVKITDPASGMADIVVQGAPSILGSLKPGDVDVYTELSNRGPGTYTVPLTVNLERFMEQVGGTNSITVEITSDVPVNVPEEGAAEGDGTTTQAGSEAEAVTTTP